MKNILQTNSNQAPLLEDIKSKTRVYSCTTCYVRERWFQKPIKRNIKTGRARHSLIYILVTIDNSSISDQVSPFKRNAPRTVKTLDYLKVLLGIVRGGRTHILVVSLSVPSVSPIMPLIIANRQTDHAIL